MYWFERLLFVTCFCIAVVVLESVIPNNIRFLGPSCESKLAYQLEQIHVKEDVIYSNLCYKLGKLGISWDDMNTSDFSQEDQRIFRKYCMEGLNGN